MNLRREVHKQNITSSPATVTINSTDLKTILTRAKEYCETKECSTCFYQGVNKCCTLVLHPRDHTPIVWDITHITKFCNNLENLMRKDKSES